jgi:hypothetical protein
MGFAPAPIVPLVVQCCIRRRDPPPAPRALTAPRAVAKKLFSRTRRSGARLRATHRILARSAAPPRSRAAGQGRAALRGPRPDRSSPCSLGRPRDGVPAPRHAPRAPASAAPPARGPSRSDGPCKGAAGTLLRVAGVARRRQGAGGGRASRAGAEPVRSRCIASSSGTCSRESLRTMVADAHKGDGPRAGGVQWRGLRAVGAGTGTLRGQEVIIANGSKGCAGGGGRHLSWEQGVTWHFSDSQNSLRLIPARRMWARARVSSMRRKPSSRTHGIETDTDIETEIETETDTDTNTDTDTDADADADTDTDTDTDRHRHSGDRHRHRTPRGGAGAPRSPKKSGEPSTLAPMYVLLTCPDAPQQRVAPGGIAPALTRVSQRRVGAWMRRGQMGGGVAGGCSPSGTGSPQRGPTMPLFFCEMLRQ